MPKTLRILLDEGAILLHSAGIENPRLAVELMMRKLLDIRRIDVYLDPDREIPTEIEAMYRDFVSRKLEREPLQYILGETEWFGLRIKCDSRALVPRPETETVVEKALEMIHEVESPRVIDIGTGTGCIAIAIALARKDADMAAVDLSPQALELAADNIAMHSLTGRIKLISGRTFEALDQGSSFDLIISNPPYIRESEYPNLMPEVRDYEPRLALVAGEDGLNEIRVLVEQAPDYLHPSGYLILEYGIDHDGPVRKLARDGRRLEVAETIIDYNQRERGMILRLKD